MSSRSIVRVTANFERNLEEIEAYLLGRETSNAFDALLDELADTVFSNLERFPVLGGLFRERPSRSPETINGIYRLVRQLGLMAEDGELREYGMTDYLLLYARIGGLVYLLSICHQRQHSFNLSSTSITPDR